MKKLKLNLQSLNAEVLTRSQLKQILGGDGGSGDGGLCYLVQGDSGHSSCWYATSGNADTLCSRVYPNESCITSKANGDGSCSAGCHLN